MPAKKINKGTISYVVPLGPTDKGNLTLFQGFSRRTLPKTEILKAIVRFPSSIPELFADRNTAMVNRAAGFSPYEIGFLEGDLLESRLRLLALPCVISDQTTFDYCRKHCVVTGTALCI